MFRSKTMIMLVLVLALWSLPAEAQTLVYVDQNAPGANNGSTWQDAYLELKTALDEVLADAIILVADGTYSPGPTRIDTFLLIDGVAVQGGYAGYGAPDPEARDFLLYETVLDGNDINYHVVSGKGAHASWIIDGFTITRGNAVGLYPDSYGGGMRTTYGSATVINCTFTYNFAERGGGIHLSSTTTTMTNCTFTGNSASLFGGGMNLQSCHDTIITGCTFTDNTSDSTGGGLRVSGYSPQISDCTFSENTALFSGGALSNFSGGDEPHISHCTFIENSAQNGGGISNTGTSEATLEYCLFLENSADEKGGGLYNFVANASIKSCTFAGNSSLGEGGGVCYLDCDAQLSNCLFTGNTAEWGAGIYIQHRNPKLVNCTFSENIAAVSGGGVQNDDSDPLLTNCILWRNIPTDLVNVNSGDPMVMFCCIEGGYAGDGNIDENPRFVDPVSQDFHLGNNSPCINRGSNLSAPMDDLDGDPRPDHGSVDMGMDEYTGTHFLSATNFTLSQSTGGMVSYTLSAGVTYAGNIYCIFGSRSETAPGTLLPGGQATLPINIDGFTDIVIQRLNTPTFFNFLGVLDGAGNSAAQLNIPAGKIPLGWVGSKIHFAFTIESFAIASNPVEVEITP